MGRVLRSADERRRIITAYKESGLSVAVFSPQENISPSTLYQWLASEKKNAATIPVARVIRLPAKKAAPEKEVVLANQHAAIVIDVDGIKLHVYPGTDAATLGVVFDVVQSRVARGATL